VPAGGTTLARLIAGLLVVRSRAGIPRLTVTMILTWADAHHQRTGAWPRHDAGPIPEAPSETGDTPGPFVVLPALSVRRRHLLRTAAGWVRTDPQPSARAGPAGRL
jgi:hypothetical protein